MWAFPYIKLPLDDTATWGIWAAEWARKSNRWNRSDFKFDFAFAKQVHDIYI